MKKTAVLQLVNFAQFASLLATVVILYVASDVLIPIALGMLVAFVLSPVVNRLQSWGLSNSVSVIVSALMVFLLLTTLLLGFWSSVEQFGQEVPKYRQEIAIKLNSIEPTIEQLRTRFNPMTRRGVAPASTTDPSETEKSESEEKSSNSFKSPTGTFLDRIITDGPAKSNDGSTAEKPLYVRDASPFSLAVKDWAGGLMLIFGPLGTIGLVIVIALFGLLYRDDLRDRLVSVISHGNYVVTAEAIDESSARVGKFLLAQLLLNISYGAVFMCGLLIIGKGLTPDGYFPHALLLGVTAGVVRFIPYLGPLLGAAIPLTISIVLFPGYQVLIAVVALILLLELVSNNIVEPWLYGSSTGVSPIAIILSAIFWGWLWGPIGLLLATPMTVCLVVLGRYVPRFRYFATLLSDEEQVASHVRGYQRLLSGDQRRIDQFVVDELKQHRDPADFLDSTLVPLIKLFKSDENRHSRGHAELLSKFESGFQTAGLIDSDSQPERAEPADADSEANGSVSKIESVIRSTAQPKLMLLPITEAGGQLMARAIAKLVEAAFQIEMTNQEELPEQISVNIVESGADIVLIVVVPPGGVSQARFWVVELRRQGYRGTILVACMGKFRNFDSLLRMFRRRGANLVSTTAAQTVRKLQSFGMRFAATQSTSCVLDEVVSTGSGQK